MDYREDYYKGIKGVYFNRILDAVINLGELDGERGVILDFGCGTGHLKRRLAGRKVIGYDVIEELSDVSDYRSLKPSAIVCNNVLEHMELDEIERTLETFRKMNRNAVLVVALPTENLLSRFVVFVTRTQKYHEDHKSKLKDVLGVLRKRCVMVARRSIYGMNDVSAWRFRKMD